MSRQVIDPGPDDVVLILRMGAEARDDLLATGQVDVLAHEIAAQAGQAAPAVARQWFDRHREARS